MKTIGLLIVSNIFMTFACRRHLKYKNSLLWKAILVSWAIVFAEKCFQVVANLSASPYVIPSEEKRFLIFGMIWR